MLTHRELKQALREAGVEVYRTQGDAVFVAERPRENLIMDSGVRLYTDLRVAFYARAEESSFPGESSQDLHERVRRQLECAIEEGFTETRKFVTEVDAPSDESQVLDRWHQVQFERRTNTLAEAVAAVCTAVGFEKIAKR